MAVITFINGRNYQWYTCWSLVFLGKKMYNTQLEISNCKYNWFNELFILIRGSSVKISKATLLNLLSNSYIRMNNLINILFEPISSSLVKTHSFNLLFSIFIYLCTTYFFLIGEQFSCMNERIVKIYIITTEAIYFSYLYKEFWFCVFTNLSSPIQFSWWFTYQCYHLVVSISQYNLRHTICRFQNQMHNPGKFF